MKHYEVNFIDRTVETVMADSLPPAMTPTYKVTKDELEYIPGNHWWLVTLLTLSTDNEKLVPFGRIHINLDNVTYIKET